MKLNTTIDPQMDLPHCFTISSVIYAGGEIPTDKQPDALNAIAQATEECLGIAPASVHYGDAPYVSFGSGVPADRWWFRGDPATGTFERCSPPRFSVTGRKWRVSPPDYANDPRNR